MPICAKRALLCRTMSRNNRIEALRQTDIEAVQSAHSVHADEILSVINGKYDERLRLYREGIKQWDTSVSVTMITRGMKG